MKDQQLKSQNCISNFLPFVYGNGVYKCYFGSASIGSITSWLSEEGRHLAGEKFLETDMAEKAIFIHIKPFIESPLSLVHEKHQNVNDFRRAQQPFTFSGRNFSAEIFKAGIEPRMKNFMQMIKGRFNLKAELSDSFEDLELESLLYIFAWLSFQSNGNQKELNFFEEAMESQRTPVYQLFGTLPQIEGDETFFAIWHPTKVPEM